MYFRGLHTRTRRIRIGLLSSESRPGLNAKPRTAEKWNDFYTGGATVLVWAVSRVLAERSGSEEVFDLAFALTVFVGVILSCHILGYDRYVAGRNTASTRFAGRENWEARVVWLRGALRQGGIVRGSR